MRILLLRTYLINIGNGFIDKGAKTILNKAFPDAEVIEISGYSRLIKYKSGTVIKEKMQRVLNIKGDEYFGDWSKTSFFDLSDLLDFDMVVIPGCILNKLHLIRFQDILIKIRKSGIPIFFLGAGGSNYSDEFVKNSRNILKKIDPQVLISRDTRAFDNYSDYFDYSYDGLDCAFFIDEWYKPPSSNKPFLVANFDKVNEPHLDTDNLIIRSDHVPFAYNRKSRPFHHVQYKIETKLEKVREEKKRENLFISDNIRDYLFLYSNAMETHSDRVHACVPTLVYGNKAKFYYDTPRGGLFEKFTSLKEINNKPVSIDRKDLEQKRESEIDMLKKFSKEIMN